jgi:hypothetical protein
MSDTSGRVSYEPRIKQAIKKVLSELDVSSRKRSRSRGSRKGRSGASGVGGVGGSPTPAGTVTQPVPTIPPAPPPIVIHDPIEEVVWSTLQARGVLGEAFESEIIAYLKRLAQFIEISSSDGMDGVTKRFDVKPESGFYSFQRKIRQEVGSKSASRFAGAAGRSFHSGSINWAKKFVHVSDPLKIKIGKLAEAVARNADDALIKSPTFILREYGKRLLESALPGGETNRKVVDAAIRSFFARFATFMEQHNNADDWRSDTLASTVKQYEKLVKTTK